jgi:hypothetical protein
LRPTVLSLAPTAFAVFAVGCGFGPPAEEVPAPRTTEADPVPGPPPTDSLNLGARMPDVPDGSRFEQALADVEIGMAYDAAVAAVGIALTEDPTTEGLWKMARFQEPHGEGCRSLVLVEHQDVLGNVRLHERPDACGAPPASAGKPEGVQKIDHLQQLVPSGAPESAAVRVASEVMGGPPVDGAEAPTWRVALDEACRELVLEVDDGRVSAVSNRQRPGACP